MKIAEALAQRQWYVVDAQGKVLGRMASEIAKILRGKNKPIFTPNLDAGDFVIVINARGFKFTGKNFKKKSFFAIPTIPAVSAKEPRKKCWKKSQSILSGKPLRGCCQKIG